MNNRVITDLNKARFLTGLATLLDHHLPALRAAGWKDTEADSEVLRFFRSRGIPVRADIPLASVVSRWEADWRIDNGFEIAGWRRTDEPALSLNELGQISREWSALRRSMNLARRDLLGYEPEWVEAATAAAEFDVSLTSIHRWRVNRLLQRVEKRRVPGRRRATWHVDRLELETLFDRMPSTKFPRGGRRIGQRGRLDLSSLD